MRFPSSGLPAGRFPHEHTAPLRLVGQADHQQRHASREWIPCPICEKTFVAAAVVTDVPEASEHDGGLVVRRRAYCDHCDIMFCWTQTSNADGSRLGDMDPREPVAIYKQRDKIDRFLRAHPEAAGVLQS